MNYNISSAYHKAYVSLQIAPMFCMQLDLKDYRKLHNSLSIKFACSTRAPNFDLLYLHIYKPGMGIYPPIPFFVKRLRGREEVYNGEVQEKGRFVGSL
jgi:hypothetical protein